MQRAKNKTKSTVRAKVEHPFLVIKRIFGFAKTRYPGLERNAHRLFVTRALENLYIVSVQKRQRIETHEKYLTRGIETSSGS